MARTATSTLNSLLRGEISAMETYQQALTKLRGTKGEPDLRRIHEEHCDAASTLREQVRNQGANPDATSGVWGAFAKTVEGAAKVFGTGTALRALKEGEEIGIRAYERALKEENLPSESGALIASALLPQSKEHLPVLDRLMAGLVDRIDPHQANERVTLGQALLVCAYDSVEKCEQNRLAGAISLDELRSRIPTLSREREIIFYCG